MRENNKMNLSVAHIVASLIISPWLSLLAPNSLISASLFFKWMSGSMSFHL